MERDFSLTPFRCKLDNFRVVRFGNRHTKISYMCEECGVVEAERVKRVRIKK